MMAFARKQDLHPVSIDPCTLSETVGGLVAQTLGGVIAIDWMCTEPASNILADQSQLELALVNLVLNARDAMPDGGTIRVEIGDASAETVRLGGLPDGPYLAIRVSDEGTGIPGDLLEKISEPFFTTKELGKGTGLGLSMAVGFVHQSGGKLSIDSQLGLGTTVEILLPATISPALPGGGHPRPQASVPLSVQRLLLVDDDEMVRTVMAEQLRELGVEVTVATDGSHALALLENRKSVFDMILTDFAMPGINGVQTITAARAIRPDMRAAIMTGYMDDSFDRHSALGVDVLRKPVKIDELVGVLA
jgi:CheY-like chemotaxis protein